MAFKGIKAPSLLGDALASMVQRAGTQSGGGGGGGGVSSHSYRNAYLLPNGHMNQDALQQSLQNYVHGSLGGGGAGSIWNPFMGMEGVGFHRRENPPATGGDGPVYEDPTTNPTTSRAINPAASLQPMPRPQGPQGPQNVGGGFGFGGGNTGGQPGASGGGGQTVFNPPGGGGGFTNWKPRQPLNPGNGAWRKV